MRGWRKGGIFWTDLSHPHLSRSGYRVDLYLWIRISACFYLFFKKIFIYLFLAVLGLQCCVGFSLVVVSGGYSLAVASMDFLLWCLLLLWGMHSRVCGFNSFSLQALEHRLVSCGARAWLLCGMWHLPRRGIKPVFPVLAGWFFTIEAPGKPFYLFFN